MFFERQGYHLPLAPDSAFKDTSTPYEGFAGPGVRFYRTTFNLSLPVPEYDIPLAIVFTNTSNASSVPESFRSLLYVNGFQFGKYVNHIGPQLEYPVPEGILNYNGENWLGVSLWNMEDGNATVKLGGFQLKSSSTPTMSGRYRNVSLSYQLPQDGWHQREGYEVY
ncbi:putative beta-galactosidase E [Cyphellophora attinorum]|uniref:Putative beta-galactosidase E n=1 Tax=Cyphellophora attinorum TaxID=1664694 RepID=A0A0N1NY22_9EURO|nr:putative beta-galactosidase E [Phialophora attinorum]KPI35312.1 putative beta-galactosidase E [Phialophora attinorum]